MDAVKAVAELKRRGVNVVLTLVGSGEPVYLTSLRTSISTLGIDDRTQLTGFVDNPTSIVQASEVLLMCSRSEAFGRVTIEAMKVGRPVIGARSGATLELVKEGFNGVLYAPGDPVDLAEKIEFMAMNRESAKRMGCNGRQWAMERFSVERYTNEVLTVLSKVLQPQGED
jgi:glycosyltransferase involved in cell wall biosynthesis